MKVNKSNIEQIETGYYLFSTNNCPTCEDLKDKLSTINNEDSVIELDAYEHQAICIKYHLIGTPCLLKCENGEETNRMYGAPNIERLKRFFKGE